MIPPSLSSGVDPHLIFVVEIGLRTRSAAFHQVGNAARAEDVQARQNSRNFEFTVAKLAAFLFILFWVERSFKIDLFYILHQIGWI